ncbi:MAG: DUF512 domain-containing protein, partial [Desulfuromusa sp.]|nr:DUF512 domain-containing protein [Desulfuromusa sp.]
EKLPQLKKLTQQDAISCLNLIHHHQQDFLFRYDRRFVFPADELYLLAEQQIPSVDDYEDFSQLENGVGMIAQFRQHATDVLLESELLELDRVILVTGCLFHTELVCFADQLSLSTGVELEVLAINNDFFGSDVTVAGLITGADLLSQLQELPPGDGILIPDVMLKDDGQLFLDGLSMEDIGLSLQTPVIAVETSPWGILDGLELLVSGAVEIIQA